MQVLTVLRLATSSLVAGYSQQQKASQRLGVRRNRSLESSRKVREGPLERPRVMGKVSFRGRRVPIPTQRWGRLPGESPGADHY